MNFKMLIVGDMAVGKSSILKRFVNEEFEKIYMPTIGIGYKSKIIDVDGCKVKLHIQDTCGQERFRAITKNFYRNANAIILVFDITDSNSFASINEFWINDINDSIKDAICFLVGNKSDCSEERTVSLDQINAFCKEVDLEYFECSARSGAHVEDMFMYFAKILCFNEDIHEMSSKRMI